MKRGIAALIILIFCIAFAIVITFTLEEKIQSIYSLAQSAIKDKSSVYALEKEWNKEVIYLELFTDHDYFEDINTKIRKLKYLEGEMYRSTCTEAVLELIELKKHMTFSLPNIL